MKEYIWLFPLIFIFHDMEEIIGTKIWLNKNSDLINRKYPRLCRMFKEFSTEGFAIAVFEELIICIFLCMATSLINNPVVWGIWIGAFAACAVHFAIHIIQAIIFGRYIPAVITSIISIPPSLLIISKVLDYFSDSLSEMYFYIVIGILLVVVNLIFAHKLMCIVSQINLNRWNRY